MNQSRVIQRALALAACFATALTPSIGKCDAPPPADSLWIQQWNMHNSGQSGGTPGIDVGLLGAWDFTTGSNQVVVAIVRDAALWTHPDFEPAQGNGRIVPDYDGHYGDHGTFIAGIIAAGANDGGAVKRGIAGIDQGCIVWNYHNEQPIPIISPRSNSDNIREATDAGADIMNISYAEPVEDDGKALAYAYNHDVVIVAPTGNDHANVLRWPAAFEWVIGVGGIRDDKERPGHSNYGPTVDLVAPDGDTNRASVHWLTSLVGPSEGLYAKRFHTSYACPHVAGAAALLRGAHPELSNDDIRNILVLSAMDILPDGWDEYAGYGLVKVDSAFRILEPPNVLRQPVLAPPTYSISPGMWFDMKLEVGTGLYWGHKHELRCPVTFQKQYYSLAGVWTRGSSSCGLKDSTGMYENRWVEFIPGTLTGTGGVLRTYVYELWDDAFDYVGWVPCSPAEAVVSYGILGEELLVTPTLTAQPADLQLTIDWVDTLPNEGAWHVDRNVGYWQTDYAVLPPGTTSFVDDSVVQGSYLHTYRVRPVNANQTPAFSNEVTRRSLPSPPPCISAYTVYTNLCSATGDPSLCPQNHGTCGGEIELEGLLNGGMAGPEGMDPEMQQMSSGGGGIDPSCCEPSNVIVVKWQQPLEQLANSIRGYYVVQRTMSGGSPPTTSIIRV